MRAGENVAVAGIRPFRLGAEEDDLLGMLRDELGGPSHPAAKAGVVRDVVIAGEHCDGGVGTTPREREEGQQDARAGVAIARLDDDVSRRQRRELRRRERQVIAVHDGERARRRHEAAETRERLLEKRAVADEPAVLLRDRRAGDQAGERLEAGAVTAGEDERPERREG